MNNQLTINELRAYQAGQLDGPARHRVERLLLEDPFYADALEGLEALQRTGASLPKQTAQLRRALHERINESATERRLFPLWVTTMAASIVLVMGVALYFIYTTKPATTAVKKPILSTHSEAIVVEIGPNDSAIAKTVETVAVLEAHTTRLRGENEMVARPHPRSVSAQTVGVLHPRPVSSQAALTIPAPKRPVRTQAEDAEGVEVILPPTGGDYEREVKPEMAIDDTPRPNYRRILNPERAFGPNAPEAPDVTLWSDNSPRLTLARSLVSPRLASTQAAMAMNKQLVNTASNEFANVSLTLPALNNHSKKTIEGTITDQKGEPLPGVQIIVKGTDRGTTTNAAGQFSLDSTLVGGRSLSIAYVGFLNQELNPLNLKNGPIQLTEDTHVLYPVVVTNYGKAKRGGNQTEKINRRKLSVITRDIDLFMSVLSGPEKEAFREYLKKEASPLFHGPLSVSIRTKADGSIKRVTVDDGILIEERDGKQHREYKPTPEVVAEAERLVRQYTNWPKKRQSLLWIMGWQKK